LLPIDIFRVKYNLLLNSIADEQELKVFVDLAMISAGEDDMEIDRISCMHTSCLGFGSLIFGYRTDHGFNALMRLCQPVWQAVDANPSIQEKLVSCFKICLSLNPNQLKTVRPAN
jgi:hypothetical protein